VNWPDKGNRHKLVHPLHQRGRFRHRSAMFLGLAPLDDGRECLSAKDEGDEHRGGGEEEQCIERPPPSLAVADKPADGRGQTGSEKRCHNEQCRGQSAFFLLERLVQQASRDGQAGGEEEAGEETEDAECNERVCLGGAEGEEAGYGREEGKDGVSADGLR